jgi:hypothetical protein
MVQRGYIECPTCGKIYQLKIQYDQNAQIFDWPICFECKECGDVLEFTYGQKGLRPKGIDYKLQQGDTLVTTIGYSSSLPITDELYLKELNDAESLVLFSMFFNLQRGHFTSEEIQAFDGFLRQMQNNFLPYRGVMKALLPIMVKGNTAAFSKKWAGLFDIKKYKPIESVREMKEGFYKLVEKSYLNIIPSNYNDNYYKRYVLPLFDYIKGTSVENVKLLKERLDESGKISLWYKDTALPYVVDRLNDIQKLIPSMIYASAGVSDVQQRGDLKIVTISYKEASSCYVRGYEVLIKGLKTLVGVNNLVENGNIDTFTNPKLGGITSITKFAELTAGKMIEHLENYATIYGFLDGSLNNKVRNAAEHEGIRYDVSNQHVVCHYDSNDDSKVYELNLIALCRMCYIQLLHIIEITLLARKIIEKAQ